MGFAPLVFLAPDGVAVYPEAARVEDETSRGDITGQRTETVVYVCEAEGVVELPPVTIPWFNPETRSLNRIELPGRRLDVSPNPAFAEESASVRPAGETGWRVAPAWLGGLLVTFCAVFLTVRFIAPLVGRIGKRIAAFRRWVREPLPPLNPYNTEERNV
jgi:hypothetical protein